jgi:hypothetical protein
MMTTFRVFYMRPEFFREFSLGDVSPNIRDLRKTHVELREVTAENLDHLYSIQQAHNWAVDYETCNALLASKGLGHTSMSIGDVALNTETNDYFAVAHIGFRKLAATPPKPLSFRVLLSGDIVAAFATLRAADDYAAFIARDYDPTMITVESIMGVLVEYHDSSEGLERNISREALRPLR